MITALVLGIFAAVRPSATASTPQAQRATASGPGSGTSPAHPRVSPARPKPDIVRWRGRVTITSNGLDLDTVPPTQATGVEYDINIGAGQKQDQVGAAMAGSVPVNTAPWNGSSFPTRQQCADQIDANPATLITVRPGDIVCVKTQAGRVAALKLTSVSDQYDPDVAEATVWELP